MWSVEHDEWGASVLVGASAVGLGGDGGPTYGARSGGSWRFAPANRCVIPAIVNRARVYIVRCFAASSACRERRAVHADGDIDSQPSIAPSAPGGRGPEGGSPGARFLKTGSQRALISDSHLKTAGEILVRASAAVSLKFPSQEESHVNSLAFLAAVSLSLSQPLISRRIS